MFNYIAEWYRKKFADPHAVTLFLFLSLSFALLYFFSDLLMPIMVAVAIAFLLEQPVQRVIKFGLNRNVSVILVMILFSVVAFSAVFGLVPVLWQQTSNLIQEVPNMISKGNNYLMTLPQQYPEIVSESQIDALINSLKDKLLQWGQVILEVSVNSLSNIVALLVYLILVPIMVFFFLKDKDEMLKNLIRFLPKERRLTAQVGAEMHQQIHNYIRGKVLEILIIGIAATAVFMLLGLRYPVLLGSLVGLSVLVPYVGATVVTIPVCLVGLFQWGISPQFGYLLLWYGIIQAVDGNILVPFLFSEAVNLHPVAIIIAVILFGGLWGFWGVFFAIPLATLVKAVINAWPSSSHTEELLVE
ncbi:AI-2E family transporter [Thalassotalea mangrovi]|uniref:AI-2E family transporter n=1 Tax=Thalassotalea mangrovi TaxID=2572245 RepID=A0A4U1B3F3_9GAMM|nr:AI-2E family transporter [Thalassotalea mangrovi]TKB44363.1 AI-2E family transporter [Thalassotalea mangrovi]